MKKVYIVMGIDFSGFEPSNPHIKIFDNPVDSKKYYEMVSDSYHFVWYSKEPVLSDFEYPYMVLKNKPIEPKEYIDKDKLIRLIDNAMYQAKSYDGHLDEDKALMILNILKLSVKTLETQLIFDQYRDKGEKE